MITTQIRRWKIGSDGINHSYFLRDMHHNKSMFKSHVYLISYDINIQDSMVFSALPKYSPAHVNIGFVI